MNITFFIGNGFDINMQLKTSYKDFYNHYLNLQTSSNDILVDSIMEYPDKWSDLELGLGEFLEKLDRDRVDDFLESKYRMEYELSEYLRCQEETFTLLDDSKAAVEFKDKIVNFFQEFSEEKKDEYRACLGETQQPIDYCFVTFNYTNILDLIICNCQQNLATFTRHSNKSGTYTDRLIFPIHVHGTLQKDLILGLDSEDQINNEELKRMPDVANNLIKPFVNKRLGNKIIERIEKIIDQSRYICLYGLSIGDTDQFWWKYILSWLKRNEKNRLVIYAYLPGKLPISAHKRLSLEHQVREKFRKQSLCTPKDFSKVQDRIIVINNSRIFNFKYVKTTSESQNNLQLKREDLVEAAL